MISFGALSDMIVNSRALDRNKALQISLSRQDIKDFIIQMNTEDQLLNEGIDSTGKLLSEIGGDYSPVTIDIKISKGQETGHITLNDTDAFYDSFTVTIGKDSFTINADSMKNGTDLTEDWGSDILGLTDESLNFLIKEIIPQIIDYTINTLLND